MPSSSHQPLRVLVVAADPLARAGLSGLLANTPEILVVGQTHPTDDLARVAEVYRPDVALWDLGWQRDPGLEQLAELTAPEGDGWTIPVVGLLGEPDAAAAAWAAGMRSLLLRSLSASALVAALESAAHRLSVLDPVLAANLVARREQPYAASDPLTPREHEVLQLMAEGAANKSIARRLQISEHTVKFHVNSILSKLGVQSRTEAVVLATRTGLIIL